MIKHLNHLKHLTYHPACPRSTKQIFIFHGLKISSVQRTRFPTLHTYFISHFSILLIYSFFTPSSLFQSIQGEKKKSDPNNDCNKEDSHPPWHQRMNPSSQYAVPFAITHASIFTLNPLPFRFQISKPISEFMDKAYSSKSSPAYHQIP